MKIHNSGRGSSSVIAVASLILAIMVLTGCPSAGGGGGGSDPDPILSVDPIVVPTFAQINGSTTNSMEVSFFEDELNTGTGAYAYVNGFNNNIIPQYCNGFLQAAKNRAEDGLPLDEAFKFTATGTVGSDSWEIRGTMVKSTSTSNPTYIAYFDEFQNASQAKDDLPLVVVFSSDYSTVYVTGYMNNDGDRLIVQHDYATSKTTFLSADSSSSPSEIIYYMEHFEKNGSSSLTYKNMWYNDTTTTEHERAIMHMVAGTGIVHYVSDDGLGSADTNYLNTSGTDITDTIEVTPRGTLDTALSTIQGATNDNDPETEWNARATVIPDYSSAEYVAAKVAHQQLYPNH